MTIDFNNIFEIVLSILGIILSIFIIPWIKSKTTKEQREAIIDTINRLVRAAEKKFPGTKTGDQKRTFVLDLLDGVGIIVDDEIKALVESAVFDLTN